MRFEIISFKRDDWEKTRYIILDNLMFTWPRSLRVPIDEQVPLVSYATQEAAQKVVDKKNSSHMTTQQHFFIKSIIDAAKMKTVDAAITKRCGQKQSSLEFNNDI